MNEIPLLELLKLGVAIAIPVAGLAAGAVKAVLNGTAVRTKEAVAEMKAHRQEVREEFGRVHDRMDTTDHRFDEIATRQAVNTSLLAGLDRRVERIEGSRWQRRGDEEGR